jgi:hypothetical protein
MNPLSPLRRLHACLLAGALALALAASAAAARVGPVERRQGERVVRHPDPSVPLAERWRWAEREGARQAPGGYWIAYAVHHPMPAGHVVIQDSGDGEGFELNGVVIHDSGDGERSGSNGSRASLGEVLTGRPVPRSGAGSTELAVLLRMGGPGAAAVERIAVRSPSLPMALGGAPVFWLGPADDAASIRLLRERVSGGAQERLRTAMVKAVALHRSSDLVIPFLRGVLEGRMSDRMREEAAEGLTRHPRADALALLSATARGDRSEQVRLEAVEAMGEMKLPAATGALREFALGAPSVRVRAEAAESLGERPSREALPVLEEVLRRERAEEVLEEAVEAVAELPGEVAGPMLRRLAWEHPSPAVQAEAAETLGEQPAALALAPLADLVARHPRVEVRLEAVEALSSLHEQAAGQGGSAAVREALARIARAHPDPLVRAEAVETLGELRGGSSGGTSRFRNR